MKCHFPMWWFLIHTGMNSQSVMAMPGPIQLNLRTIIEADISKVGLQRLDSVSLCLLRFSLVVVKFLSNWPPTATALPRMCVCVCELTSVTLLVKEMFGKELRIARYHPSLVNKQGDRDGSAGRINLQLPQEMEDTGMIARRRNSREEN